MQLKYFFADGTATFINGPANLLNNAPKNAPGWNILDIWVLESFISVDILFSHIFLYFAFCFVVNNSSRGNSFASNICTLILKVIHV